MRIMEMPHQSASQPAPLSAPPGDAGRVDQKGEKDRKVSCRAADELTGGTALDAGAGVQRARELRVRRRKAV